MSLVSCTKTDIKAMNDVAPRRYVEIASIVSIARLDLKREPLPVARIYMILTEQGSGKQYEE
jgi:hypothetical protein